MQWQDRSGAIQDMRIVAIAPQARSGPARFGVLPSISGVENDVPGRSKLAIDPVEERLEKVSAPERVPAREQRLLLGRAHGTNIGTAAPAHGDVVTLDEVPTKPAPLHPNIDV